MKPSTSTACSILLLAAACSAQALDSVNAIELGDSPVRELARHTYYFEDASGSMTAEEVVAGLSDFEAIREERIDFGFSESTYWLLFRVTNPADQPLRRFLSFNMRFMQQLDVYLRLPDGLRHRLYDGAAVPFGAREFPHRHLLTDFTVPAGETVDVLVRYWSEGATALPLTIETASSLQELQSFRNTLQVAFYTFLGFMLLYSLLFLVIVRERVFAFYVGYLGAVGLYLAHMDGLTFQFLWPDAPEWNSYAALPLGMVLNPAAALFSMAFLKTRDRHPLYHRVLYGVILVSVAWILASWFLDVSMLKQYAFIFTFLCACIYLGGGINAYLHGYKEARFYAMGWLGLTFAAVVTTAAHWSAGLIAVGITFELMRVGVIADATLMGLAVLDQYSQTKKAKDEALARETGAIRARYEMQDRLLGLEERYNVAHQLAAERGLQLATASHDLRQPLTSIRMSIRRLQGAAWAEQRAPLEQTLSYLEGLVERYLVATADAAPQREPSVADGGSRLRLTEPVAVDALLRNLRFMFEHEAAQKSLALRTSSSRARIEADVLVVVRILSNLVANAIRYTEQGGIVLGCRRKGDSIALCVYDTGPGIRAAEIERIQQYYERGSNDPQGFGLGLAISQALASEHEYRLRIRSVPGKGTCAALEVPAVPRR